jgi:hypothetical protein
MTIFVLIAWLVLTRTGRNEPLWPSDQVRSRNRPNETLELDETAVSLEVGVAAIALMLIPWTMFLDSFPVWEVLALLALWPFVFRYCVDRILKLRAGYLARATDQGIEVPGFPRRTTRWANVKSVDIRRVRFGPDDVVIRVGLVPIVLDTQFTSLSEPDMIDWVTANVGEHL